ncbi:DUF2877 domain-containing protein [Nocardioides sp. zg-1230]|uniref:oxamate carbamoyltransferase subunit AllH family protein n=1 Tax=Nocardioides sp. zg-1230 TaxID=2736601 RepID=UPI001557A728|nr:DUF2877 domain-containing protein [Nocardioides sp. zg-1230]NPC42769.1 DUF2877 domain-containing protein [Nocardioides sp. zg-1230]
MSGPISVAAPQRVHDRLREASDGPREVVHASSTAVYVDLDGWCLGLVSATATRVPCALWSTLPDLGVLDPVVQVHRGELVVGDRPVRVTRLVDPRVTRVGRHEISRFEPTIPMTSGLDLPADGRLTPAHLDRLLGRGPGLTPLGDDVLSGWLTTRAALGQPDDVLSAAVRRRLGVTTLLSATLLDCAIRGEALPQLADWLAEPTDATTDALLAVGATSGAGLLAGAGLALASIEDHTTPRRVVA